jgi:hypothetical protein
VLVVIAFLSDGVGLLRPGFRPSFEKLENASVGLGMGSPQWLTITQILPLSGHSDGAGGHCGTGRRLRLGNLAERIELGEEFVQVRKAAL